MRVDSCRLFILAFLLLVVIAIVPKAFAQSCTDAQVECGYIYDECKNVKDGVCGVDCGNNTNECNYGGGCNPSAQIVGAVSCTVVSGVCKISQNAVAYCHGLGYCYVTMTGCQLSCTPGACVGGSGACYIVSGQCVKDGWDGCSSCFVDCDSCGATPTPTSAVTLTPTPTPWIRVVVKNTSLTNVPVSEICKIYCDDATDLCFKGSQPPNPVCSSGVADYMFPKGATATYPDRGGRISLTSQAGSLLVVIGTTPSVGGGSAKPLCYQLGGSCYVWPYIDWTTGGRTVTFIVATPTPAPIPPVPTPSYACSSVMDMPSRGVRPDMFPRGAG